MFQIEEIRQRNEKMYELLLSGIICKEIAQQYGISCQRVRQIIDRIKLGLQRSKD
jgi:DNA-binding CsgD family transcriptional regulator